MTAVGFLYPGYSAEDEYPAMEELLAASGRTVSLPVVHTLMREDAHRVDALLDIGGADVLAEGARSLRGVDAAVWACTSGSFVFGWEGAAAQVDGVRAAAGAPASSTSFAFVNAARHLGLRRVAVAATYPRDVAVAANPHNVLCGRRGVARVFGPQKGASPAQVEELAAALDSWADVLSSTFGCDVRHVPGGGASGGLGAGLAAALGASLLPRFDVMLDHVDLDSRLADADLVITAEGAIDFQTALGKVPAEVARRAKRHGKPVIALAGTIGKGARRSHAAGIDAYAGILAAPVQLAEAMDQAAVLLTDATERALRLVLVGTTLNLT
jgi:Glycerate kinase family/Arylmalonate decarboxylase